MSCDCERLFGGDCDACQWTKGVELRLQDVAFKSTVVCTKSGAREADIAEGRRMERERIAAWLDTKPTNLEEKTCYPPEPRDRVLARAIRNGEHEKGDDE